MSRTDFSLVIPVLNEEANIRPLIERILAVLPSLTGSYEIIFIDDSSTDRTVDMIEHYSKNLPVKVYSKFGKRGKSYSLIEGFNRCQYDIVGMIDGDLQYPPEALPEMIRKVSDGGADIVIGSRKQYGAKRSRLVGTKVIMNIYRVLFNMPYDIQSGLKVFKKDILAQVDLSRVSGWTFDFELLHEAHHKDFVIDSVDIMFDERIGGKSKVNPLLVGTEIIYHALGAKIRRAVRPVSKVAKKTWAKLPLS